MGFELGHKLLVFQEFSVSLLIVVYKLLIADHEQAERIRKEKNKVV